MKNFRTYQLAMDFYHECQKLKIKNRAIKDQFERSSLSIVLNLAEGYGKLTIKDRRKFYSIALGSLRETSAILEILNRSCPETCFQNTRLPELSDKLGAYIYKLIQNPGEIKIIH